MHSEELIDWICLIVDWIEIWEILGKTGQHVVVLLQKQNMYFTKCKTTIKIHGFDYKWTIFTLFQGLLSQYTRLQSSQARSMRYVVKETSKWKARTKVYKLNTKKIITLTGKLHLWYIKKMPYQASFKTRLVWSPKSIKLWCTVYSVNVWSKLTLCNLTYCWIKKTQQHGNHSVYHKP